MVWNLSLFSVFYKEFELFPIVGFCTATIRAKGSAEVQAKVKANFRAKVKTTARANVEAKVTAEDRTGRNDS